MATKKVEAKVTKKVEANVTKEGEVAGEVEKM
jgi:hypothetical protein